MEVKKYRMARSWLTDPDSGNSAGQWKNFVKQRADEWKTRQGFQSGQLVDHGPAGVRQGYGDKLTSKEKKVGFSTKKGAVKSLTTEQEKVWNQLNPDLKWEDYKGNRGNWMKDWKRKQKVLKETKGLISQNELAKLLTEEFGEEISAQRIYGRYGSTGKTHLAAKIDELLYKGKWGNIYGGKDAGGVTIRYFKSPTERDIRKLKSLLGDVRINRLSSKMVKAMIALDNKYADIYSTGNVPSLDDVAKSIKKGGLGLDAGLAGRATARLAQVYSGHKFKNSELDNIRIRRIAGNKLFQTLETYPFGDPYRSGVYKAALETIDEKLGNKKGTFAGLKKEARDILRQHNIPVYSKKSPFGFNINEIAGVTGSAKSGEKFSQYIDIMEGNLNTKTLANYQGQLSKYRQMIHEDPSKLPELSKKINIRARALEKAHGIKLARLVDPSKAGAGLKVASQQARYALKMPTGAQTIAQFVKDPTKTLNRFVKTLQIDKLPEKLKIELARIHNCPIKVSSGGRIGFSAGGITGCLEGKLKNDPMKFLNMTGESALASKSKNILGFIKGARTAARVTGLGLVWEAAFAPLIMGWMASEGESWERMKHDLSYGPILEALGVSPKYVPGESEEEELMSHFKNDPKAYAVHKLMEIGGEGEGKERMRGELDYLYEDWSAVAGEGTPTSKAKGELWKSPQLLQIEKLIKDKEQEYQKYINTPGFYQGPAGQYKDQEAIDKAFETRDEGLASLEEAKAERLAESREKGWVAPENWWDKQMGRYAGGGMTGIRRPDAVPPLSGPDPQGEGLSYLLNRVRKE